MKNEDCCEYYQKGLDELNRIIITEQARNPKNMYKGEPFKYCPWCGKYTEFVKYVESPL